jgi:hypothetical protein
MRAVEIEVGIEFEVRVKGIKKGLAGLRGRTAGGNRRVSFLMQYLGRNK